MGKEEEKWHEALTGDTINVFALSEEESNQRAKDLSMGRRRIHRHTLVNDGNRHRPR